MRELIVIGYDDEHHVAEVMEVLRYALRTLLSYDAEAHLRAALAKDNRRGVATRAW